MASPGRLGLEAAAGPATASAAVGLDDHVPQVPGVGGGPVEQLAVEDDPPADAGRDRQHAVVVVALGGALPPLGERQRLAVEVAVDAGAGQLLEPGAQRELPPRRDVDGRDGRAVAGDRPGRPDPDAGDAHLVALGGVELLLDDPGQRLEVGLRPDVLVDQDDGAVEQVAAHRDEAGGELGAADVDGEHGRWQPLRRRRRDGVLAVAGLRRCGLGVVIRCVVFVRIQTTSREG